MDQGELLEFNDLIYFEKKKKKKRLSNNCILGEGLEKAETWKEKGNK